MKASHFSPIKHDITMEANAKSSLFPVNEKIINPTQTAVAEQGTENYCDFPEFCPSPISVKSRTI